MKLDLNDFWGKRVGITWAGQFRQGVLSEEKSNCSLGENGGYITLISTTLYDEYRIDLGAIDSIGLFEESQQ